MVFKEDEGITVITTLQQATEHGLHYDFVCRKITLDVHSNLDAVGFLATITTRLARELNIGVNPVTGFYHDHLFVKVGVEEDVLRVLREMALETWRETFVLEEEDGGGKSWAMLIGQKTQSCRFSARHSTCTHTIFTQPAGLDDVGIVNIRKSSFSPKQR